MAAENLRVPSIKFANPHFAISWNWGAILIAVAVWCYGFEAYGASSSPVDALVTSLTAVLAILVIFKVTNISGNNLQCRMSVSYLDVITVLSYFAILCPLSFGYFQNGENSLNGDQLYHAQTSQIQAAALVDKISTISHIYSQWQYKNALRVINAGFLLGFFLIAWLILQSKNFRSGWLVALVMLLIRYLVDVADIHPPLRLFPLWIASIVFGVSDIGFRLVSMITLCGLALVINKALIPRLGIFNAFLSGLAVTTIPLVLHVGSIVEQSIWTTCIWTTLLLIIKNGVNERNAVQLMCVACISSLLRAPIFVIIIPILILIIGRYVSTKDGEVRRTFILACLPLLVLAPALFVQIARGTPATDGQADILIRLSASIADGFSLRAFANNVPVLWIGFFLFAFVRTKDNLTLAACATFFMITYIVFYSIRPVLWGVPRYQAELWIPFVAVGFVEASRYLGKKIQKRSYIALAMLALVMYNFYANLDAYKKNLPVDDWRAYFSHVKTGEVTVWSESVYDVTEALDVLRSEGYQKHACKVGQVHEVFSEALAGYTVDEMQVVFDHIPQCSHLNSTNQSNLGSDIKVVLFLDVENRQEKIATFLRNGTWKPWASFHNSVYGSTIIGLIRP